MLKDIPHEASLILNFFSGKIYFIFESKEEIDSFLSFINQYDNRFNKDFSRKLEIKSVAWKYNNLTHRIQLEWADTNNYFKRYDMYPISYSIVMDYINKHVKIMNTFIDFFKGDK